MREGVVFLNSRFLLIHDDKSSFGLKIVCKANPILCMVGPFSAPLVSSNPYVNNIKQ